MKNIWSAIGVTGVLVVACGGEYFNDVGDLNSDGKGGAGSGGSGAGASSGAGAAAGTEGGVGEGSSGGSGVTGISEPGPNPDGGMGGTDGVEQPVGGGGAPGNGCGDECFTSDHGACECPWVDETTQLMWEDPPKLNEIFNVYGGNDYCIGLIFAGRGDWRLPTIEELRTLIRGCPDTVTGGACPVTNASPASDSGVASCGGCAPEEGPGHYFEFWDPKLSGESNYSEYLSSTSPVGDGSSAWYINFLTGEIATYGKDYGKRVRCVRTID